MSEIIVYIFDFFLPQSTVIGHAITRILWDVLPRLSFLPVIGVIVLFWRRSRKKMATLLELFSVVYLCSLIIWGIPGGTRYIFPLVGATMILGIQLLLCGFKVIRKRMPDSIAFQPEGIVGLMLACLVVHNTYVNMINFYFDDNDINKKEVGELVAWVRNNVGTEERVMFPWNRALGLLTERKMATYFIVATKERSLGERIQKHHIKYLIFPKKDGVFLMPRLEAENIIIQSVWTNDAFQVVTVNK
jgi:hypothetical protein